MSEPVNNNDRKALALALLARATAIGLARLEALDQAATTTAAHDHYCKTCRQWCYLGDACTCCRPDVTLTLCGYFDTKPNQPDLFSEGN